MGYRVVERIETMIENNQDGRIVAAELEQKLKEQNAYRGKREDTNYIILNAEYYLNCNLENNY